MRHSQVRASSFAVALSLAAGFACGAHDLRTFSSKSGSGLTLDGATVHTTTASVIRHRLFPMTGSTTVVATWDEVQGGATKSFFAISLNGRTFSQVRETENKIPLRYATFDPLRGEPAVAPQLRATKDNELFIVQFVSTPLDEMRRDIRQLGGVIESSIPDQAHLVRMNTATRDQVAKLPYVRWVGACEVAYRLPEELRALILNPAPDAGAVRYSIACLRSGPEQQGAVADAIVAMGGIVEMTAPDMFRMEATLTPQQLLRVAQRNEIDGIDLWGGPGGTDMTIARQIGGASTVLAPAGFLGQGVRGEIHDTGVVTNHVQWNGQAPLIRAAATDSHGNACYGINFATGNGDINATGMCPQREQGIFIVYTASSQFTAGQPTRLSWNTGAVDPNGTVRSCYQTSSVGSTQVTAYTTISQEVDDYLFKIDYLSCQSQSNTGNMTSRPQAWAKNILSVGGVVHNDTLSRADDNWGGASYGPAQDGRVKPDLWHFYDNIYTTYSTSPSGYGQFSGTSGATPITAGHFGLLMQMWHQGVWAGFGGQSNVFTSRPFSTTAKALMTNGAWKYPITATNTRMRQGWGMADLGYLYNIRNKTFIVNADQPIVNAQTRTYNLTVTPGEPELRVTMCYIDPRPTVLTNPNRVNDLTLRVTAPNGNVYWGNNGLATANISTTGGVANTVDTVEHVWLPSPAAGNWVVDVIGSSITVDAYPTGYAGVVPGGATDAGFSLVVTGAVGQTPPPTCYANCDASTGSPLLTANDFQCFVDKFAGGDSYANCDGSTGTPALTSNDFQCFINKFAAGCT